MLPHRKLGSELNAALFSRIHSSRNRFWKKERPVTNKTRRRITIEEHEVRIIRRSARRITAYCEQCGSTVTALIPKDVTTVPMAGTRTDDFLEPIDIHLIESADSDLPLLCDGSLEKSNKNTN
jgi:hypothetical protein